MLVPTQKDLYLSNRARLQAPWNHDCTVDAFEHEWITRRLSELPDIALPASLAELKAALANQIAAEQRTPQAEADYVAGQMSLDEFRILVQEFAIDGLTEAQVFYYVLPRLPLEAQMPLLRIMIDEFGSGNLKRAHTTLYVNLLRELGMPTALTFYLDQAGASSFEFVNLFFWLALRADDASYFAGALTYLETAIPAFFECYARACRRLKVDAHAYYTEHQHIDTFHAVEGHKLLATMNATGTLDAAKACQGARLVSYVTDLAFRSAVNTARQCGKSLEQVAVA
ncbi:TPA: iron-containing redox enzyme family protein [Burkholderia vietnamiensis]|uniref:iron-containing redox enzyme family protein n=1 Tax=Burkholderia vietnamiensis TaxID=60552 RepID=UPI001BA1D14F|nr:iron-containing redox enzyme family protein [Burkholderia vietnamiensis]MBR7910785.1 iron-containing redox enzyme family protein [Burkholderia vietnamiensis]HDR9277413.1 iron-containing redox enzyme family protein [Burkholderia vietnamiensis]